MKYKLCNDTQQRHSSNNATCIMSLAHNGVETGGSGGSMNRSFQNPTVKTALKSVDFDKVRDKNKLALFYGPRCS